MLNPVQYIETQIGYSFKNKELLRQALTRKSVKEENKEALDNEVLEFYGDTALQLVVMKKMSEFYGRTVKENGYCSSIDEGRLTEIKKKLVCREMLASRIKILGLHSLLMMGKGDIQQKVDEQKSVQEDLFEAMVGAVAIDSNWNIDCLTDVVELLLDPEFYFENGFDTELNYVELLQQWCQKRLHCLPVYRYESTNGLPCRGKSGRFLCKFGLPFYEKLFWDVGDRKSSLKMSVAKQAYKFLEENNLLISYTDEIGEPSLERAINQLQELYQKGYIGEQSYEITEYHDESGNPVWHCECHIEGEKVFTASESPSKKQGKKQAAYEMLCYILKKN